jgi:hypothetical protein
MRLFRKEAWRLGLCLLRVAAENGRHNHNAQDLKHDDHIVRYDSTGGLVVYRP